MERDRATFHRVERRTRQCGALARPFLGIEVPPEDRDVGVLVFATNPSADIGEAAEKVRFRGEESMDSVRAGKQFVLRFVGADRLAFPFLAFFRPDKSKCLSLAVGAPVPIKPPKPLDYGRPRCSFHPKLTCRNINSGFNHLSRDAD